MPVSSPRSRPATPIPARRAGGCRRARSARFVLGDEKAGIRRKFYGDDALIDRCIVTLMSNRGLLLVGEPGTAKSMLSELLAAAIGGDSTLHDPGHLGHDRGPDHLLVELRPAAGRGPEPARAGPGPDVPGDGAGPPVPLRGGHARPARDPGRPHRPALRQGAARARARRRRPPASSRERGFNVLATANIRDRGVHEMSSALKRRFNFETVRPITDRRLETRLVREQTETLLRAGRRRHADHRGRRRPPGHRLPRPARRRHGRGRGRRAPDGGDVLGGGRGGRLRRRARRALLRRRRRWRASTSPASSSARS